VAPRAGVELYDACASGPNSLAVVRRRLVAFHHIQLEPTLVVQDGSLQEPRLPRPRRAHQIERQDLATRKPCSISGGDRVVLREHSRLEREGRRDWGVRGSMGMIVMIVIIVMVVMVVMIVMVVV
jgi:hypothetical protein